MFPGRLLSGAPEHAPTAAKTTEERRTIATTATVRYISVGSTFQESARPMRRIHWHRQTGFTLVELMVVVAILGLLAAIAIPTMTKLLRRAKTSEARVQIAKMFDSASGYFQSEHVARGTVTSIGAGGTVSDFAAHLCPYPAGSPAGGSAATPFTPTVDCNEGPGGHCVPGIGGGGGGSYDFAEWADNAVWNAMNFQQEQAHFFHYNFTAANAVSGYGNCQFTASAFGNLNGDAVYSTFERTGGADANGINAATGLYIDRVVD
jgi:type IV pilus assembly protein PilA